jgi:protoporphyrinogen oxidase
LFSIFFKTYTEKVWGLSCEEISADWAAQRIKGLSLYRAVLNALWPARKSGAVVKTLIDKFEYPRLGPGMMWEKTRDDLRRSGHQVILGVEAVRIHREERKVIAIETQGTDGAIQRWNADHFIVSMPLRNTVDRMVPPLPVEVREAAARLQYRDFLTVALMVRRSDLFPDNWIYVHDPAVKLGRVQNFNNWSPEMVPDRGVTCLGLEYFCFVGDGLWTMSDEALVELGKTELAQLGLVNPEEVFDGCVVRMEKAYPVYGPGYAEDVQIIRQELSGFTNLQPVGRNGLHKYNNQDHSMMTALLAARNVNGEKFDLWKVNTDAEYHEEASGTEDTSGRRVPEKISD